MKAFGTCIYTSGEGSNISGESLETLDSISVENFSRCFQQYIGAGIAASSEVG
jgi:hypothetical protein